MLDVVVVFVDCGEAEFLNLPPRTLRQVVETTVYCDVAAQNGGDGIYHGLFEVAYDSGGVDTVKDGVTLIHHCFQQDFVDPLRFTWQ